MQKITSTSVENLPRVGYLVSKEEHKKKFNETESHMVKQTPLTGVKADAHQLYHAIFTYFPKAFKGSKNSDFYEYLSLGTVPNIIGSGLLIGLYSAANYFFNDMDKAAAGKAAKQMGAGVVLYAAGKWAFQRITRAATKGSTAVPLDDRYDKMVIELPEPGQEKGKMRVQKPRLLDSVEFPRIDLMAKDGELNHDNMYYHDDKIVKKAGFKNRLNASNQTAGEKMRKVKARQTALENIGKYIVAATGVAYGFQDAFKEIKFSNPRTIITAFKDGAKQLWEGTNRNAITKYYGKALVLASAAATVLTWLIPTLGFKHNPNTMKNQVDTNKEHEVC